jgi:hypothetical protein
MEWNGTKQKFERQLPLPPPIIAVNVSLMTESHKSFGVHCKERPGKQVEAVADTGCQTSTCGQNILRLLDIPERYLIPTNHGIVGITDTRLKIMGTVMLKIGYNGKETRQMVYVSTNSAGLYLSEKALADLGLIDSKFPNISSETQANAVSTALEEEEDGEKCECIPRAAAPEPPKEIPYPPTDENKSKLKSWLLKEFSSVGGYGISLGGSGAAARGMHSHFSPSSSSSRAVLTALACVSLLMLGNLESMSPKSANAFSERYRPAEFVDT